MVHSEQLATQSSPQPNGSSRKTLYPLLAIGVALAFAANAWFFYRQGQEEALSFESDSMPRATIAWTREEPSPTQAATATDNATAADTAQPPAAAGNESAKPAGAATDKPAVKRTNKAKSTNRTMLATATKPATLSSRMPSERRVALLSHPKPAYPVPALRERQQGTVVVLAQVDVAGQVSDARVVHRSGSFMLDRAAMNEVRRWKFEPALHNGQPVVASVEVPVSYRLDQ
jgi:protein TonB